MSQPLFYTSNRGRKPEFELETFIFKSDGKLMAEKRATSPEALTHLSKLADNYRRLAALDGLGKRVQIVAAHKKPSGVQFNYIDGKPLERVLLEQILDRDEAGVCRVVDRVISLIDALPAASGKLVDNTDYVAVFGKSYQKRTELVAPALIDLNLDNFIVDKSGKWHLFDYEWMFDFPVAKLYLIQRIFWWFLIRYQELFSYHAEALDCHLLAKDFLVPGILVKKYAKYLEGMSECQKAEGHFQVYAAGESGRRRSFKFYDSPLRPEAHKRAGIDRLLHQRVRLAELKDEMKILRANNVELKAKISDYESRLLVKVDNKFLRRKS